MAVVTKYECGYLNALKTGREVRYGIGKWICSYNRSRTHSSLDSFKPENVCTGLVKESLAE
jgi:hypothetical protein